MARLLLCGGAILIATAFTAPTAHGQMFSLRRTLDVRAEAFGVGGVTTIDDPPAAVRDPDFFGSFSTSAAANSPVGFMVGANIQASTNWTVGRLQWNASGFSSSTSPLGEIAFASGTGQAVINVLGPTIFEGTITAVGPFLSFNARLRDSNNADVWSRSASGEHQAFNFTLAPGQYTVDLNFGTQHEAGHGGNGGCQFMLSVVPEPASAALLAAPCLVLARRPRR